MVACVAAFMDVCYLVCQDEISVGNLDAINREINLFIAFVKSLLMLASVTVYHYPDNMP
jgi:hypothetical protein